jgi:tetrahydrodipicolinate N-acetyltransferase
VVYTSGGFEGKLTGIPAQIGDFSVIEYGGNVVIGKNVKIGYGVIIASASTIVGGTESKFIKKPIIIGDCVEIGSHATILPGVIIGNNATIGAGAVVLDDVPANSVVAGVPAKLIKWKN